MIITTTTSTAATTTTTTTTTPATTIPTHLYLRVDLLWIASMTRYDWFVIDCLLIYALVSYLTRLFLLLMFLLVVTTAIHLFLFLVTIDRFPVALKEQNQIIHIIFIYIYIYENHHFEPSDETDLVHSGTSIHVLDSESPRLPCHVMGQLCHGLKCPGGVESYALQMVQPMAIYMPKTKNSRRLYDLWVRNWMCKDE